METVPKNYLKAIVGSYLASRYVYKYGLESNEFSFYMHMTQLSAGGSTESRKATPSQLAAKM